jgi:hypothetical protein
MTLEQWTNLEENNIIQYRENKYKLLFKDSIGRWITETLDFLNRPVNFRKLEINQNQIRGFSLVGKL